MLALFTMPCVFISGGAGITRGDGLYHSFMGGNTKLPFFRGYVADTIDQLYFHLGACQSTSVFCQVATEVMQSTSVFCLILRCSQEAVGSGSQSASWLHTRIALGILRACAPCRSQRPLSFRFVLGSGMSALLRLGVCPPPPCSSLEVRQVKFGTLPQLRTR